MDLGISYSHQSLGVAEQPNRHRRLFSFLHKMTDTAEIRWIPPLTVNSPTPPPFRAAASLPTPPPTRPSAPTAYRAMSSPPFSNHSLTCKRTDTFTQPTETPYRPRIVHVRGTPASGKTSMARLLEERLVEGRWQVVLIRTWPSDPSGDDYQRFLSEQASKNLRLNLHRELLDSYDIVFFIDRAQLTFIHNNL